DEPAAHDRRSGAPAVLPRAGRRRGDLHVLWPAARGDPHVSRAVCGRTLDHADRSTDPSHRPAIGFGARALRRGHARLPDGPPEGASMIPMAHIRRAYRQTGAFNTLINLYGFI